MSSHHYDQTWAVRILKIRLLVLRIWAKSLFSSKPEIDFQRQHFSISSLRSHLNICRLNLKIPLLVPKIWAISLFPSEPEVDFQWQQFSFITTIKPENIPFRFRKSVHKYQGYEPKTCFRRSFSIFLAKPEVDSKYERQRTLFCTKFELLAFEFWKTVQ